LVVLPIIPEVDVKFKLVALATPKVGVIKVGEVAKTLRPLPVLVVIAANRFALDGVAKKVAMPAPRPLMPVLIGSPVQFVKVPEVGVPNIGVTRVGDVPKTFNPVPVLVVIVAAKFALLGAFRNVAIPVAKPLMPVETGNPVQFVRVPEAGVPSKGVTKLGLVAKTNDPVPVLSVTAVAKLALEGVPRNVAIPVPKPLIPVLIGSPVQFVKVPEAGIPNTGATNVGEVAKTRAPVPVSSVIAAAKLALLGVDKKVAIPAASPLTPVEIGRPVQLVRTPEEAVPNAGVIKEGELFPAKAPEPLCPDSEVFTALLVAIQYPYPIFNPVDCGAPCAVHVVFSVVQTNLMESNLFEDVTNPLMPTELEEDPI
jgi:hypothetical protein